MALSRTSKIAAAALAVATLVGTADQAFAQRNRYTGHRVHGFAGYHHRGIGPGPAIAGAALGVLGAAAAGVAANNYYNGYPAYGYGPDYGPRYGYDYHPGYGYYGPY